MNTKKKTGQLLESVPRNTWMGAEFLETQYGITDLSAFEYDPRGWGNQERYLLPFDKSVTQKQSEIVTRNPSTEIVTQNESVESVTQNSLLKNCLECGESFPATKSNQLFCSDACKMKDYRKRKALLKNPTL
jgi:hypothetical protein